MGSCEGKVALVTGASRGIGRATAIALAKEGAQIILNYASNEEAAQSTAKTITDEGGLIPILKRFDVANADEVNEAFQQIKKDGTGLHILVNNAGISKDGLLLRFKDDDWHTTLNTNLSGTFYCARAAAKLMTRQRWGRIINISSVVGEAGNSGQIAYASAKAGLLGLTKTIARELASRQITCNAVSPGFIETDMTAYFSDDLKDAALGQIPLGRMGAAHDVAAAVVFLAGESAGYITGHTLAVNGGMYM